MRVLRVVLSILLLLIIVGVIAVGLLCYFLNPNDLKPVIISQVKRQTGYQLSIPGKLSWSFYPQLGIKIERMTLTAPNQSAVFAELGGIHIATTWSEIRHAKQKLKGDLYISSIKLVNLRAQSAHIGLHWQNNVLTIQPMVAKLYGGSLSGVAHGRELRATPKWDWDVHFTNVNLQPLLDDVNGADSKLKLTGVGNINLQASTVGKSRDQILSNLQGKTDFALRNGVVQGMDVNYLIVLADALINKDPIPAPTNLNQTAFESLTGSAIIKNGVATTDNLTLTSSAFLIKAQGNIDLPSRGLNLELQAKTQHQIKTQWEIPILISGDFQHPNVRLDMREVQKILAQKELEKVKTKVQDEIKKRIPGKAGEILQNFLGQ